MLRLLALPDAAQVLPLLPASPRSAIIVTSRRVLAAIDATVHLGLKYAAEAGRRLRQLGRV